MTNTIKEEKLIKKLKENPELANSEIVIDCYDKEYFNALQYLLDIQCDSRSSVLNYVFSQPHKEDYRDDFIKYYSVEHRTYCSGYDKVIDHIIKNHKHFLFCVESIYKLFCSKIYVSSDYRDKCSKLILENYDRIIDIPNKQFNQIVLNSWIIFYHTQILSRNNGRKILFGMTNDYDKMQLFLNKMNQCEDYGCLKFTIQDLFDVIFSFISKYDFSEKGKKVLRRMVEYSVSRWTYSYYEWNRLGLNINNELVNIIINTFYQGRDTEYYDRLEQLVEILIEYTDLENEDVLLECIKHRHCDPSIFKKKLNLLMKLFDVTDVCIKYVNNLDEEPEFPLYEEPYNFGDFYNNILQNQTLMKQMLSGYSKIKAAKS